LTLEEFKLFGEVVVQDVLSVIFQQFPGLECVHREYACCRENYCRGGWRVGCAFDLLLRQKDGKVGIVEVKYEKPEALRNKDRTWKMGRTFDLSKRQKQSEDEADEGKQLDEMNELLNEKLEDKTYTSGDRRINGTVNSWCQERAWDQAMNVRIAEPVAMRATIIAVGPYVMYRSMPINDDCGTEIAPCCRCTKDSKRLRDARCEYYERMRLGKPHTRPGPAENKAAKEKKAVEEEEAIQERRCRKQKLHDLLMDARRLVVKLGVLKNCTRKLRKRSRRKRTKRC
jgi:hypothetical protein